MSILRATCVLSRRDILTRVTIIYRAHTDIICIFDAWRISIFVFGVLATFLFCFARRARRRAFSYHFCGNISAFACWPIIAPTY